MKVLRLCRTLPREINPGMGLQPFYCIELSEFASITFTKKMPSNLLPKPNCIVHEVDYKELGYASLRISLAPSITKIWGDLKMLFTVLTTMKRKLKAVDIIHCHSIHYLGTSIVLKNLFDLPIVLSIGGTDIRRVSKSNLFRFLIRRVDCIVYVARSMEKNIELSIGKKRKLHISNGLNKEIFTHLNLPRSNTILAVGNVRWQKGYEILFDAYAKVCGMHDIYLKIIGSYTEKDKKELLNRIPKEYRSGVFFLGSLTQTEINLHMNTSRLLSLSSVSEGLPKVLIEAQAAGLPIVATDVGDCKEVVGKSGIIVASKDSLALFNGILKLLNPEGNWKKYHKSALAQSKDYSWEDVVKKIDALYLLLKR